MLLRFVVKNFLSFNEETEFNLFPSSRTQNLSYHKANANGVDILRMSALYGANGSGKSNLIKAISELKDMVIEGVVKDEIENKKFKLAVGNMTQPTEFGIEFSCQGKNYYYTISINNKQVVYEYLAESAKAKDIMIFERKIENNKQNILFYPEFLESEKNKYVTETIADKFLEKNQLLISLLASKYAIEFFEVEKISKWFENGLNILSPYSAPVYFSHMLDVDKSLFEFVNKTINELSTGISNVEIEIIDEEKMAENDLNTNKTEAYEKLMQIKGRIKNMAMARHPKTKEELTLVIENDSLISKRVFTKHQKNDGSFCDFTLPEESDGTQRLIDFLPAFYSLIFENSTFIIDEIERSIHPLMIKELITKFSKDTKAKGQLIFSTHESCLLDQDIIRTDEVWFAQKDGDGSSKLYSLSDYKVHNTLNIENNYLSGRYGAIPFLSNLKDLNWHKEENVEA